MPAPEQARRALEDGDSVCTRCGKAFPREASRRGRTNRARGNRDELEVARLLGGSKVGPLGLPHDVEVPGYMRLQCKKLASWPSLAKVISWLDAMAPHDDIRGVTVADTPGPGTEDAAPAHPRPGGVRALARRGS